VRDGIVIRDKRNRALEAPQLLAEVGSKSGPRGRMLVGLIQRTTTMGIDR
jgi:hypothetical protein